MSLNLCDMLKFCLLLNSIPNAHKPTSGNECMVLMKQEGERQLGKGWGGLTLFRSVFVSRCVCVCVCAHRPGLKTLHLDFLNDCILSFLPQVVTACLYHPVVQWGAELTVDTACMCRFIPRCTLPVQACSSSASSSSLMLTVSALSRLSAPFFFSLSTDTHRRTHTHKHTPTQYAIVQKVSETEFVSVS